MVRSRVGTIAFVLALATVAFAGCIADDVVVDDTPEEAPAAEVTEKTGSVTGQVITEDLDLIPGVEIGLVNRTGGVLVTTTDKQARYTFNDVAPGPYRVEVDPACCRATSTKVDVAAGKIAEINLRLPRLTAVDRLDPFVLDEQWDGFVGCDVSLFSAGNNLCDGIDANQDTVRQFQIEPGIQELVVGMVWNENTALGDVYGNALGMHLYHDCEEGSCYRYLRVDESSPIIEFLNDARIIEDAEALENQQTLTEFLLGEDEDRRGRAEEHLFSVMEEPRNMRWNIFSGGTNVVYQQSFTMYWFEFYHHRAPVDFSPLPPE